MSGMSRMFRCGGSRQGEVVEFHKIFRSNLEDNQFHKKPDEAYSTLKNAGLDEGNKTRMVAFVGALLLGLNISNQLQFGGLGNELKDAATYLVANQRGLFMPGASQKLTQGAIAVLTLMCIKEERDYKNFQLMKTNITTQITSCPAGVLKPEHKNKLIVAVQNLKSEDFTNNHYLKGSNNDYSFFQTFRDESVHDNNGDGRNFQTSNQREREIIEPQQPTSSTNHRNSTEGSAGSRSGDEERWLRRDDDTTYDTAHVEQ